MRSAWLTIGCIFLVVCGTALAAPPVPPGPAPGSIEPPSAAVDEDFVTLTLYGIPFSQQGELTQHGGGVLFEVSPFSNRARPDGNLFRNALKRIRIGVGSELYDRGFSFEKFENDAYFSAIEDYNPKEQTCVGTYVDDSNVRYRHRLNGCRPSTGARSGYRYDSVEPAYRYAGGESITHALGKGYLQIKVPFHLHRLVVTTGAQLNLYVMETGVVKGDFARGYRGGFAPVFGVERALRGVKISVDAVVGGRGQGANQIQAGIKYSWVR